MSSTESSGAAPAEATATPAPASPAAPAQFGTTRGSGLARGKRPSTGPAPAATAAATEYTPTAIELVSAPREYQNPFAPAETPAAVSPQPAPLPPAPVAAQPTPAVVERAPIAPEAAVVEPEAAPAAEETPAELNILEPERPKPVPAQTWESEGFRPAREPRTDDRPERPRREEVPVPAKFRYERAKDGPLPQRGPLPEATRPSVRKSGVGFFGWLKALFGGSSTAAAPAGRDGERRHDQGGQGNHRRRHRGGRGRSHGYPQGSHGGEHRSDQSGGGSGEGHGEHRGEHRSGGGRRHRGGRGRSHGEHRGEHRSGGEPGGPAVN